MASANAGTAANDEFLRVEQTSTTEAPEPQRERASLHTDHRGLLTLGVMGATIMQILDSTIANVALPHMAASLGATADTITWVLTSYILASAVAIPITGWLSDRIGSRQLFLIAIVGFVVASMLCGMAGNIESMVLFRILQGTCAAFMNPLSQTVLMDINPPSRQARAMSIWGQGVMVGPILGPIVGGWLTESYNWRWCFYVNVPVGVACFALLWWLLPSREIKRRQLDALGFSMLAIALCAFQLVLDRGQDQDWFASWEIRIEAMVAAAAFWVFLVQMVTGRRPMFDRELLADRNLMNGIAFMAITAMVMLSTLALLPPMLQNLYGYPVLTTGFILMARGVGLIAAMRGATVLIERQYDLRIVIFAGMAIIGVSLWRMTYWTLAMETSEFVITGVVQGVGMGLVFSSMNIVAFGTLKPDQRTEGASLMNLSRNVGGSIGISAASTLLARNVQINHQVIGAHIPDSFGFIASDPLVGAISGATTDQALAIADGMVNQQAAMISYLNDFKAMMIGVFCVAPLILLIKRSAKRKSDENDHTHVSFE